MERRCEREAFGPWDMEHANQSKDLLVVGGADGIGMWLVKRVFCRSGEIGRITLADIKPLRHSDSRKSLNPGAAHLEELARVPKPLDAVRLDGGRFADWAAVRSAAERPDGPLPLEEYRLIMLAVPEEQVESAASSILPRLREGAAVFDVVSTKARAIAAMLRHAPDGVGVLGIHPLFGPAVPDIIGQTVMIVPTERTDPDTCEWLTGYLRSQGAIVEETDAESHDRYMLLVQTLAHYAYLVFGKTLSRASDLGYTFEESLRYSTPPYSILAAFTSRIIGGNPHLYARIQEQADADELRSMFVEAAEALAVQFSKGGTEILSAIEEIVQPFRGSDVARAYANSIALVDGVHQSYRDLYRRMESRELTIVQVSDPFSSHSGARLHVGVVTDLDGRSVEITKRQTAAGGKWYIAYDDESEAALKRAGKAVRRTEARIERRNIRRVFTREETREWRAENLDHHRRDIAVLADDSVDMEHVCAALTRLNEDALSGEAVELDGARWLGRYGMNNVLLRFTIFGDRDAEACIREIKESLRLFGIRTGG